MAIDFNIIPSPSYVVEEKLLRRNLEILNRVQEESGATIICALKGFAMWSTFGLIKQYLGGATASSLNEARLCFEEMGSRAHVCAPAYKDEEFDELLSYSGHITFNSITQWERYKEKVLAHTPKISAAIRINPEYAGAVDTDLYNPCSPGSRLGVTNDQLTNGLPEGIEGIHFHALCENNSYELEELLQVTEEKFGHLLHEAKWLNMGGGHHITREDYDLDLLIELIRNIRENYKVDVILEPGEAVGWQTGYLVSTVLDIVDNHGIRTAMLDTSFTAHMPDCLEMPYKPVILNATDAVAGQPTYRMGGMSCLAGDFMGDYSFNDPLKIGDRIVFNDMAHYTMVKTTTFNGVNLPSICIWKENDELQVVREFGYEDYKNRLS